MNRASTLRLSLLIAIGAIPAACGGATNSRDGDADPGPGSKSNGQGGSSGKPGGSTKGGAAMQPGTIGKAGTTGFAGTAGAGPAAPTCTSPKYDAQTGLVSCAEGYVHRAKVVACGQPEANGSGGVPTDSGDSASGGGNDIAYAGAGSIDVPRTRANGTVDCSADAKRCDAFEYGYCQKTVVPAPFPAVCFSGCVTDADCGSGAICLCTNPDSPTGGECRDSNCASDTNCGAGFTCASYSVPCSESDAFACQTPNDECLTDTDCPAFAKCTLEDAPRACAEYQCGRPFLVHAALRVAPPVSTSAWTSGESAAPRVDHLSPTERRAMAEHWTKMGQMEHASIAAFARFSLQLLSLGAPPELVEACTAALADETAHTKLCFGIASAYAGCAIGPGPLDITGSLEVTSLAGVVDLVIVEGCFGETSAALEALEAADSAADPVIAAAYSQIAEDEQRHAELAFRFVRWALEREPAVVASRIETALAEGRISASVRDVAAPCLTALLATRLVA